MVLGVYFGPPIVVRNPLWCCGAGAGVCLFLLQRSLSEITDVGVGELNKLNAPWTRLFRSVPPSPRGKGQVPSPRDSTLASDGHHPSAVPEAAKYIHSPRHVSVVRWRVFEYSMCVSQLLTPRIVLILHRLITYPTGSLANTDVRVWRLQPIPPPHHPSYRLHTTRTRLTQRRVLTPVPPATSLGGSCSPRPCPRLPRPAPQHHRLRIKNE